MHVAGTGAFSGLLKTCRQVYLEDGIRGFYHGCLTNLLRTTPAAAVTFTSFELLNRKLRAWAKEPNREERAALLAAGDRNEEEEDRVALAPPFSSLTGVMIKKTHEVHELEAHLVPLQDVLKDKH